MKFFQGMKFYDIMRMFSPIKRAKQLYFYWWLPCVNRRKLKINLLTRQDRGYPECTECGLCCAACPAWDIDTRLCKIWKDTISTGCRTYPVSPLQSRINPESKEVCRYYWGTEKNPPTREEVKEMIKKRTMELRRGTN